MNRKEKRFAEKLQRKIDKLSDEEKKQFNNKMKELSTLFSNFGVSNDDTDTTEESFSDTEKD